VGRRRPVPPWRRAGQWVVAGLVAVVGGLVGRLPLPLGRALGTGLGRLAYWLVPGRRRVALANLTLVYGDTLSPAARATLARRCFEHLGVTAVECCRLFFGPADRLLRRVRGRGTEHIGRAMAQGRGIFFLTGHFGNWEVATIAGIQNYPEVRGRIHFVRRPIKPRWLDALVTRRFNRSGFGVIGKRGSLDDIVTLLERGDVVVFPFDQYAGGKDGIDVEFFGERVGTFKSLAVIALASGATVLPAACWRTPEGTHVLKFEEPVPAVDVENTNEAIVRTTRAYNAALERLIVRHPEQWWWVHRRWRQARRKRGGHTARHPVEPRPNEPLARSPRERLE